jgi:hypothetical protein
VLDFGEAKDSVALAPFSVFGEFIKAFGTGQDIAMPYQRVSAPQAAIHGHIAPRIFFLGMVQEHNIGTQ